METVGKRIRKYRKEKGLTQKQLGEKCGILEPNIRKYELEKQNPKLETIEKIALALEIPLSDLITFDNIHGNFFNERWNNLEKYRLAYIKNIGYEIIEPKNGDTFFTIYHDGYKYTIPYEEPEHYYDLICEILDSYAKDTLDNIITQYSNTKEEIK